MVYSNHPINVLFLFVLRLRYFDRVLMGRHIGLLDLFRGKGKDSKNSVSSPMDCVSGRNDKCGVFFLLFIALPE